MGLGLHGGGLACAKFLAKRGAALTVTDLRDRETLLPSITLLDAYIEEIKAPPVRYVLGEHRIEDFEEAGLIVKNPAVSPASPYLRAALRKNRRIESDLSLFLRENKARLSCVTGSKGKSFTASALHWALDAWHKRTNRGKAFLGGNITRSPLDFPGEPGSEDDVVLELSSFQLGDLFSGGDKPELLKPRAAIITAIMRDHLDRYGDMESYISDKKLIYRNQTREDIIVSLDDEWGRVFAAGSRARSALVPVQSFHQKTSLLLAETVMLDLGPGDAGFPGPGGFGAFVKEALGGFPGIEHRFELFLEKDGVKYYNDTAATIPEAAAAGIRALGNPVLVTGGTDKELDFTVLAAAAKAAKKIALLDGSASVKLAALFKDAGIPFAGPFDDVRKAAAFAAGNARAGDCVLFSPGCASFGMFLNEFDRGRKWKAAVTELLRCP